jgi:TonB family protein
MNMPPLSIVLALAISVSSSASAAETQNPQSVGEIANPVWRQKPSQKQVDSVYPMQAMWDEKVGTATVQCRAGADGGFVSCRILCEAPKGYGFGRSALAVLAAHTLVPTLPDGRSVAGMTVTTTSVFSPEASMNPPKCEASRKP